MRLYIAGPMSGLPELNYPAFFAAAERLRAHGYRVENPAENPAPACGTWLAYMRMALRQITRCDGVVMLPGWEASRGAKIEHGLFRDLGLPVWSIEHALQQDPAALLSLELRTA